MAFRMTEQAYLVLVTLADGPRHGYGIVRSVGDLSDGVVRLGPGTLYGLLDRLCDAGYVAPDRDEVVNGRLRRYYRITDSGSGAALAETERLAGLARRARTALTARPALGSA
jgi:DNA-binding PadR family transcriptional regulator